MLTNLLKYEFKASGRVVLPIASGVLVLNIFTGILSHFIRIPLTDFRWPGWPWCC